MTRCGIARLQDIEEMEDGRCPYRPVRHHRAVELMPEIRRFARDDEDLAGLRDEPAFIELTAE